MKIDVGNSQATTSIQAPKRAFGINASAKAFRVLSSSLYNFKILAVVREISCNARDAHAMNKTLDKPFNVKLPCMEDLHFTVRDFGPGLSPEDVMGMYTTYFESTKATDNEAVGGFGLGSKSPLSYTTSFQVVTYHGGKRTAFLAFQNDSGEPDIYQLSETDTTEPTGMEVIVPVQEQDIRKFRASAANVYRVFKVAPVVTVNKKVLPATELYGAALKDFAVREVVYEDGKPAVFYQRLPFKLSEISDVNVWAQMGDVIYPVAVAHVFDSGKPEEAVMQRFFEANSYGKVVIECVIGELDLNAGREGLSYDRATIGRLKTILSLIYGKLIQEANSEIAGCSHYADALLASEKFISFFGQNALHGMFSWRGMKVDRRYTSSFPTIVNHVPDWKNFITGVTTIAGGDCVRYAMSSHTRGEIVMRHINAVNQDRVGADFRYPVHFVIVDEALSGNRGGVKDRVIAKFGGHLNDKFVVLLKFSKVVATTTTGTDSANCVYRDIAKNRQSVQALIDAQTFTGNIHFLSDMPVVAQAGPKGISTANGVRRELEECYMQVARTKGDNHLYRAVNFTTADFDPEAKTQHFYLKGNKSSITLFNMEKGTSRTAYSNYWDSTAGDEMNLFHAWAEARAASLSDKKFNIYYLTDKQIEQIKDNKNWVHVQEQMFLDFAAIVKSVGKYGALMIESATITDSEAFKVLRDGSPHWKSIVIQWNDLAGQSNDNNTFHSYGFGTLMLRCQASVIKDRWAEFLTLAAIDQTLYTSHAVWASIFRSSKRIYFIDFIKKQSQVIATATFSRWNDKKEWAPELCSIWEKTPGKISVTDYLDQFFTGKK